MDTKYNLSFSCLAEQDLDKAFDYIATMLKAPDAAKKLMHKMDGAIRQLCSFPQSCELCRDGVLMELGYRRLIVDNYVVVYTANEKQQRISILRVFYGRQNYIEYF